MLYPSHMYVEERNRAGAAEEKIRSLKKNIKSYKTIVKAYKVIYKEEIDRLIAKLAKQEKQIEDLGREFDEATGVTYEKD